MRMTFEKIIPELDKCILVCNRCHVEIEYEEKVPREGFEPPISAPLPLPVPKTSGTTEA